MIKKKGGLENKATEAKSTMISKEEVNTNVKYSQEVREDKELKEVLGCNLQGFVCDLWEGSNSREYNVKATDIGDINDMGMQSNKKAKGMWPVQTTVSRNLTVKRGAEGMNSNFS